MSFPVMVQRICNNQLITTLPTGFAFQRGSLRVGKSFFDKQIPAILVSAYLHRRDSLHIL